MESIVFIHGHQIDVALHLVHRKEMSADIQVQASPLKFRIVLYKAFPERELTTFLIHQLKQGLQSIITASLRTVLNDDPFIDIYRIIILDRVVDLFELKILSIIRKNQSDLSFLIKNADQVFFDIIRQ